MTDQVSFAMDDDARIAALHQYIQLVDAGNPPAINEYAKQHESDIELENQLRGLLAIRKVATSTESTESGSVAEIPNKVGGYLIQRKIAAGGMGVVYEAYQESLGRKVAIKVLKNFGVSATEFCARFEREAIAASSLHHNNIVSVFDYGVEEGCAWIAMPLIDGISLDKLMNETDEAVHEQFLLCCSDSDNDSKNGIDKRWNAIASLASQLTSALEHAHEHGMVHRDIKPGNLLLDRNGKLWVTDFGLSKLNDDESDLTQTGAMIGTPRYMAPEQFRGIADARSDIYGVGITLWELCCSTRAWQTAKPGQLLDDTPQRRTDFAGIDVAGIRRVNPGVPEGLANIIMRACSHHPDDRYQSAREMRFVLNRFAYGEKVIDRRRTRRDAFDRPYLRKHFLLIALFTAALAGFNFASIRTQARALQSSSYASEMDQSPTSHDVSLKTDRVDRPIPLFVSREEVGHLRDVVGGRHAEMFYVDAFNGTLHFRPSLLSNQERLVRPEPYEVVVAASRELSIDGLSFGWLDGHHVLRDLGSGTTVLASSVWPERGNHRPSTLRAICSPNGKQAYHAHESTNGKVQLWQSDVVSDFPYLRNARLLNEDCRLPTTTSDFVSADGQVFYVFTKPSCGETLGAGSLIKMRLSDGGRFTAESDPEALDTPDEICGAMMYDDDVISLLTWRDGIHGTGVGKWSFAVNTSANKNCFHVDQIPTGSRFESGTVWRKPASTTAFLNLRIQVTPAKTESEKYTIGPAIALNIQNEADVPVQLVGIDKNGFRKRSAIVASRSGLLQRTFSGATWEFYAPDGSLLEARKVDKQATNIIIGDQNE